MHACSIIHACMLHILSRASTRTNIRNQLPMNQIRMNTCLCHTSINAHRKHCRPPPTPLSTNRQRPPPPPLLTVGTANLGSRGTNSPCATSPSGTSAFSYMTLGRQVVECQGCQVGESQILLGYRFVGSGRGVRFWDVRDWVSRDLSVLECSRN